jgi:hypothetical protein
MSMGVGACPLPARTPGQPVESPSTPSCSQGTPPRKAAMSMREEPKSEACFTSSMRCSWNLPHVAPFRSAWPGLSLPAKRADGRARISEKFLNPAWKRREGFGLNGQTVTPRRARGVAGFHGAAEGGLLALVPEFSRARRSSSSPGQAEALRSASPAARPRRQSVLRAGSAIESLPRRKFQARQGTSRASSATVRSMTPRPIRRRPGRGIRRIGRKVAFQVEGKPARKGGSPRRGRGPRRAKGAPGRRAARAGP